MNRTDFCFDPNMSHIEKNDICLLGAYSTNTRNRLSIAVHRSCYCRFGCQGRILEEHGDLLGLPALYTRPEVIDKTSNWYRPGGRTS
jgi:hypothetical protein